MPPLREATLVRHLRKLAVRAAAGPGLRSAVDPAIRRPGQRSGVRRHRRTAWADGSRSVPQCAPDHAVSTSPALRVPATASPSANPWKWRTKESPANPFTRGADKGRLTVTGTCEQQDE